MQSLEEHSVTHYFNCIPLDILAIILIYYINGKKEDALIAWKICKEWRKCVRINMERIVKNWNCRKYRLEPTDLTEYGISVWDRSLVHFVLYIARFFQNNHMKSHLCFRKPNFIFLIATGLYQTFTIKISHTCTIWNYDIVLSLINLDENLISENSIEIGKDVIIKEEKFGVNMIFFNTKNIFFRNWGNNVFRDIENIEDPDVVLDKNDVDRLMIFIDKIRTSNGCFFCTLQVGPNSFALTINSDTFINTNSAKNYVISENINAWEILYWIFYVDLCGSTPCILVKYNEDTFVFNLYLKCDAHTSRISFSQ